MSIFKLPDLGEGLPDAEIREWHVAVGDTVSADQVLVSMETAKAVVEVPSPQNGTIVKLHGKVGDTIDTGAPLIEFLSAEKNSAQNDQDASTVAGKLEISNDVLNEPATGIGFSVNPNRISAAAHPILNQNIKATPAVRQLAKQLGVDLTQIKAQNPNRMTTAVEVEAAAKQASQTQSHLQKQAIPHSTEIPIVLKGAKRAMAVGMAQSHQSVAPATIFDDADIAHWPKDADITVRLILALIKACQTEPGLNGWYDHTTLTFTPAGSLHLGLAVDTEEGLFVPVMHQINTVNPNALRDRVETLKTQIKNRTIPAEQLKGMSLILSNIGTVAGRYATPIVVPPTVAILAVGKIYAQVVLNLNNQQPEDHRMIPLSLTFDHRCVTGAQAARFLGSMILELKG